MDNATFQKEVNLRALRDALKASTLAPSVAEITIMVPVTHGAVSEQIFVIQPGVVQDGTTIRVAARATATGFELGIYASKPSRYPGELESKHKFDATAATTAEAIEAMLLAEIGLQAMAA